MIAMNPVAQQVLEESRRFQSALPRLLPLYRDKWVIFKDGEVRGSFDDDDDAYVAAVKRFGVHGGFVIAQVTEEASRPVPVTAGIYFGVFPS